MPGCGWMTLMVANGWRYTYCIAVFANNAVKKSWSDIVAFRYINQMFHRYLSMQVLFMASTVQSGCCSMEVSLLLLRILADLTLGRNLPFY